MIIAFLIFCGSTFYTVRSENLLIVNCDEKMPQKEKLSVEKGQKTLFGTSAAVALVPFFLRLSIYLSACFSLSLFLLLVSRLLLQVSFFCLSDVPFTKNLSLSLSLTHSFSSPLFSILSLSIKLQYVSGGGRFYY